MARKHRDTIRLYGEDGIFMRRITPDELVELQSEGRVEAAYEMRGDQQRQVGYKLVSSNAPASRRFDSCALTEQDMRANVGITDGEPGIPADVAIVTKAQERVAWWPKVYDTKAVYVPPRL